MTFDEQAILITGASRGLGCALSRTLAERGARLVLVARNADRLESLAAELRRGGAEAHALAADLSEKRAIYPLAQAAAELVGPLDYLVHVASTLGPERLKLLVDTECEELERALAVNLVGPFRLSRIVAGQMALRRRGTLVHISSDAAVEAYARWGAYGASKAAQDHLSRIWAEELSAFGVRSLSIDPGDMDTDLHAQAVPDADRSSLADPRVVAERIASILEDPRVASGARVVASAWRAAT
jgi:NAD(P)-dependent dehydrogenase (short-subunit alcohol dehydrogenase family)